SLVAGGPNNAQVADNDAALTPDSLTPRNGPGPGIRRPMTFKSLLRSGGCLTAPKSPLVVNVKDKGAKGDGRSDDTAAIQTAIDDVGGTGGTVLVPSGTYMVDAVEKKRRLALRSDMTLKLAKDAILKAIPNDSRKYSVLSISGVSNVTLVGGTLEGDRTEHQGKAGEAGMGLRIERGAKDVTVAGVTSRKMWGDGFYVEDAKNTKFCAVTADNNR